MSTGALPSREASRGAVSYVALTLGLAPRVPGPGAGVVVSGVPSAGPGAWSTVSADIPLSVITGSGGHHGACAS